MLSCYAASWTEFDAWNLVCQLPDELRSEVRKKLINITNLYVWKGVMCLEWFLSLATLDLLVKVESVAPTLPLYAYVWPKASLKDSLLRLGL